MLTTTNLEKVVDYVKQKRKKRKKKEAIGSKNFCRWQPQIL